MTQSQELDRYRGVVFHGLPAPSRRSAAVRRYATPLLRCRQATPDDATLLPEAAELLTYVLTQAGVDPRTYRASPLARRVPACLRALRAPTPEAALERVRSDPLQFQIALDTLLIGVTSFYRDRPVFDELRWSVLPELLRGGRPLNVLSVACSDGAELYTVAALLAEAGALANARLCGIDCRPSAIAAARAGRFGASSLQGLPADLRDRWFVQEDGAYLPAALRADTWEWKLADATALPDAGPWDLILCRNMAIYLDSSAAGALWVRLEAALRPGGVLVVGKAERPVAGRLRRIGTCIYHKDPDDRERTCP